MRANWEGGWSEKGGYGKSKLDPDQRGGNDYGFIFLKF